MDSTKIIYYLRWPFVVLLVALFFISKFSNQISLFLKNYIIEIRSADIASVAVAYAWPFVVLLTICKFGDSITKLLSKINEIEIKIKDIITFLFKQAKTDPSLEKSLDDTRKEKLENKLNEILGKQIDENILKQIGGLRDAGKN